MKTTDYPEKIYAFQTGSKRGTYTHEKPEEYIVQEYTRSDLISKWHKYPDEKPEINNNKNREFNISVRDELGEYVTYAKYYFNLDIWEGYPNNEVIAWQELPEPYKED